MLAKSLNMLHKIILTHCLAANMLSAVTSNNGTQVWFTKARTLASNDLFHPHPRMTFCFCKNVLYSVNKRLFVCQTLINEDIDPFFLITYMCRGHRGRWKLLNIVNKSLNTHKHSKNLGQEEVLWNLEMKQPVNRSPDRLQTMYTIQVCASTIYEEFNLINILSSSADDEMNTVSFYDHHYLLW